MRFSLREARIFFFNLPVPLKEIIQKIEVFQFTKHYGVIIVSEISIYQTEFSLDFNLPGLAEDFNLPIYRTKCSFRLKLSIYRWRSQFQFTADVHKIAIYRWHS